jgi:hypothetical protein
MEAAGYLREVPELEKVKWTIPQPAGSGQITATLTDDSTDFITPAVSSQGDGSNTTCGQITDNTTWVCTDSYVEYTF